jgi:hypothetical protein
MIKCIHPHPDLSHQGRGKKNVERQKEKIKSKSFPQSISKTVNASDSTKEIIIAKSSFQMTRWM